MVLLQGQPAEPPSLGSVLLGQADAADAVIETTTPGLDLLPADVGLADANLALTSEIGRERRLRVALESIEGDYDYVILDTSPQRSLLTVNALVYVHEVIVPVDAGLFAVAGLGQLQGTVEQVKTYLDNPRLRIAGLVLTRTRADNVSRDVERQLRELFGQLVYRTAIPQNVKIEESHSRYLGVLDYSPTSAGAKAYAALVEEIANGQSQANRSDSPRRSTPTDNAA
jgi:chromosome partitioning protein